MQHDLGINSINEKGKTKARRLLVYYILNMFIQLSSKYQLPYHEILH